MTMNDLQKEILNIRKLADKQVEKDIKPIIQAYKKALNDVRTEIAQLYVKYAVDGILKLSKQQRYTFLKNLEKQLKDQAQELGNIDLEHTTKILNEIYKQSYYQTAFVIDKGVSTTINFSLLTPKMVEAAVNAKFEGATFSNRIWKNKELLINSLHKQIENGIIQGHSVDKMAKVIKNQFGSSAYQSKRLINTELTRVVTAAQNQIYLDSDVVQKVMWDATLDNKVCDDCAALDGKSWDKNENHPAPPLHPEDRCCLIPIVSGWSPTKKRENQGDKPIIDYSSYDSWSKSKGIK
ncbi:phage head morphogenesis protein [Dehalobacter sp. TeCB1]|nr:phage head morphogenesis protein [Dehalobacter sp. TeCB1]